MRVWFDDTSLQILILENSNLTSLFVAAMFAKKARKRWKFELEDKLKMVWLGKVKYKLNFELKKQITVK